MKYDLDALRGLYLSALKEKHASNQITAKEAVDTLDALIEKLKADSVDDGLINELTTNPKYLHTCAGSTGPNHPVKSPYRENPMIMQGDNLDSPVGDLKHHPDLITKPYYGLSVRSVWEENDARRSAGENISYDSRVGTEFIVHPDIGFTKEMKGEFKQFEIRLLGRQVGSSYVFHAYWKDHTNDGRDNVGVYYSFSIPKDEIADKVTRIADNPELIIPIFRGVYSHWDRSNGALKVREVSLQDLPNT